MHVHVCGTVHMYHICTMYTCTGHMYDVHVLHVVVCEDNNKKVKKSTQILKLFLLNTLTTCTNVLYLLCILKCVMNPPSHFHHSQLTLDKQQVPLQSHHLPNFPTSLNSMAFQAFSLYEMLIHCPTTPPNCATP